MCIRKCRRKSRGKTLGFLPTQTNLLRLVLHLVNNTDTDADTDAEPLPWGIIVGIAAAVIIGAVVVIIIVKKKK